MGVHQVVDSGEGALPSGAEIAGVEVEGALDLGHRHLAPFPLQHLHPDVLEILVDGEEVRHLLQKVGRDVLELLIGIEEGVGGGQPGKVGSFVMTRTSRGSPSS